MSENVKKIRELNDFVDEPTPISIDDILIIATGPDDQTATPPITRRDQGGNSSPVAAKTLKATIDAVMKAYNASLIPPAGSSKTPSEKPSIPVDNGEGGTYQQDTTPFTAANLEDMIGDDCGLKIVEVCHDADENVVAGCDPIANVSYKTKKLCISDAISSIIAPSSGGTGFTINEDGDLEVEVDNAGGLEVGPNGLRVATSASSTTMYLYVNATTGTPYIPGTTHSDVSQSPLAGSVVERFAGIYDAYSWIKHNVASRGLTINILLETDTDEKQITNYFLVTDETRVGSVNIWSSFLKNDPSLRFNGVANGPYYPASSDVSANVIKKVKVTLDTKNELPEWNASTTYNRFDRVHHNSSAYICREDGTLETTSPGLSSNWYRYGESARPWVTGTVYGYNDKVHYNDRSYKCTNTTGTFTSNDSPDTDTANWRGADFSSAMLAWFKNTTHMRGVHFHYDMVNLAGHVHAVMRIADQNRLTFSLSKVTLEGVHATHRLFEAVNGSTIRITNQIFEFHQAGYGQPFGNSKTIHALELDITGIPSLTYVFALAQASTLEVTEFRPGAANELSGLHFAGDGNANATHFLNINQGSIFTTNSRFTKGNNVTLNITNALQGFGYNSLSFEQFTTLPANGIGEENPQWQKLPGASIVEAGFTSPDDFVANQDLGLGTTVTSSNSLDVKDDLWS